ncbi:MDR family MFS transporter [Liquorilactobacillus satsumensis]|uniref:MDR family MFS transporter n=1 Tax=Liquorilactobacillus satsumensis TaxID=259059 RepID=UPI00226C4F05|nr:MDR family MFS transporter [Liquorilactobacillus satsumensis]MCC7666329.1 MFS transporter [Liquorilactobacillus satsumensis]
MNEKGNRRNIAKVAFVLVLGAIAPMLDTTMTNVALNTIMNDLNSSVDIVQWVTTGYVLALGVIVLFTGWAADRFNGKKLYLVGMLIFLAGSLISGIATNIGVLIGGRLIQGAGSGIVISLVSTLIVRAAGGKSLGSLMAIVGLPVVLIPILGPTIGGYLIDRLNWHWIFYINVPIVILSFVLIGWLMPSFPVTKTKKNFDWCGFFLLGGMFSCLILGIVKFSSTGNLATLKVLLPSFMGVDLLAAYLFYAKKFPQRALISLDLFKSRNFSGASIILLMSGITVNGAMFLLPLYLQNIQGLSVVWSGTYLMSQGVGLLVSRSQIGKLTDRFGARWIVIGSLVLAVLSTWPFIYFNAATSKYLIWFVLFFRGIAQGGIEIPVMADSYSGIPSTQISEATTATRMLQNVGGAFGSAILATVIQNRLSFVVPTVANQAIAYQMAFIWSVVITAIAVVPAWFLSHHDVSKRFKKELEG